MVKTLAAIVERLALIVGGVLVFVGVHQIHPPTALIVAGAMLIAAVIWRKPWAA
jgi:hypothetical protein